MPALNYQRRFAPLVKHEVKRSTLRPKRKRPIKPGEILYHFTGQRTKQCERLLESICKKTTPMRLKEKGAKKQQGRILFWKPWIWLTPYERQMLAMGDGFRDWPEMRDWFRDRYGLPFEGVLIEW